MVYYNKFCTYKSLKSFSWWFLIYPSHAWILHLSQCDDDKIVWTVSLCDRHPDYVMAAHTYRIWKLSFYINKKVTYKKYETFNNWYKNLQMLQRQTPLTKFNYSFNLANFLYLNQFNIFKYIFFNHLYPNLVSTFNFLSMSDKIFEQGFCKQFFAIHSLFSSTFIWLHV